MYLWKRLVIMTGIYYRNTNFSGFDEGENCYPYNIVDLHRFLMGESNSLGNMDLSVFIMTTQRALSPVWLWVNVV